LISGEIKVNFALIIFLLFVHANVALESGNEINYPFQGTWRNGLKSEMFLTIVFADPYYVEYRGWYESKVGDFGESNGKYDIFGRSTINPGVEIISWNVVWANENKITNSVTSWNGYFDPTAKGKIRFYADWIFTENNGAFWNSTLTGQDIFTLVK